MKVELKPLDIFEMKVRGGGLRPARYRVLRWVDKDNDCIVFPMPERIHGGAAASIKMPFLISKRVVLSAVKAGTASLVSRGSEPPQLKVAARPAKMKTLRYEEVARDRAAILREFCLLELRDLLEQRTLSDAIKLIASRHSFSETTTRRLIFRYFELGLNFEAAVKRGHNGGKAGRKRAGTKKLGRKRSIVKAGYEGYEGINSQEHRDLVISYIQAVGKDRKRKISQQLEDFYSLYAFKVVQQSDGTFKKAAYPATERLSYAQFRSLIKEVDGIDYYVRHMPDAKRTRLSRAIGGDARERIPFPGHTYVIDSTVADVYLVSAFDRGKIIGRPVVYVVIDAYSSLILAIYVTLSGPNSVAARKAFYLALSEKKKLLMYLGLENFEEYFRAGMRPSFLLYDRAELHSKDGRELLESVNVSGSVAAAYRCDWKSLVERTFGVINDKVIHWLPGAVIKAEMERGKKDQRLDAVLTLHEFWRMMVLYQMEWNLTKSLHGHINPPIYGKALKSMPLNYWDCGTQYLHGSPYIFSQDELVRKVLQPEALRIDPEGIVLNGRRYFADWMNKDQRFAASGFGEIHYANAISLPECPEIALCEMEGGTSFQEVFLRKKIRSQYPVTHEDVGDLDADRKNQRDINNFENQEIKDEVNRATNSLIEEAKAQAKIIHTNVPKSNAERTKNVRKNRDAEISGENDAVDQYAELSPQAPLERDEVHSDLDSFIDALLEKKR